MNDSCNLLILELHQPEVCHTVTTKLGDTGRKLIFMLKDNGNPYTISQDCYAVFTAKKPDGTVIYNSCDIANDLITYTFTPQTCSAAGSLLCELRLYGADNKLITSPRFSLVVEETVYSDGETVDSATEVSALTALVSNATTLIRDVEQKLADNAYADAHSAVCYTPQSLLDSQKEQARTNIAAAPAGYGLGTIQPVEWSSIDNITANGWYSAVVNREITPGAATYMAWVRVDALDTNYACQTAYITGGDYVLKRHKQGETWGEWEWVDPPMVCGIEYRTTERWQGKAVYTKLVDCGTIADSKEISHGVFATIILRYSGTMSDIPMPVLTNEYYQAYISVTNTNIILHIKGYADYTAIVQLWYIKD